MSKIATYSLADSPLQLSDRLIGTEAPRTPPSITPLATKNFSLGELLQLFSSNFPAATLQAVLDAGNIATQDITLTGTINVTLIKPTNIEDMLGSQGTTFQILSKAIGGFNWVDPPVSITLTTTGSSGPATLSSGVLNIPVYAGGVTPNLQQVTNEGNTTTNSIIIDNDNILTAKSFIINNTTSGGYTQLTSDFLVHVSPSGTTSGYANGALTLGDLNQDITNPVNLSLINDTTNYGVGLVLSQSASLQDISLIYHPDYFIPQTPGNSPSIFYIPYKLEGTYTLATLDDIPAAGVTSVTATSPITSSGGATPDISTSMATNKLIGRSTAGTGVMEEITVGTGLSLTGGTLSSSVTGGIQHATASGTDTYTATIAGVTSYSDADAYLIRFTNGNTTGATLNINALGAIPLYRNNDGVLIGGDIISGGEMLCVYNSTTNRFQVIGTAPNSLLAYVTNDDSVTLTKGMPVYAFSGTGDRMTVKRAFNTSDATSAQTVGLVLSTSIAANQKGFIMMQGLLDGLSILPTATWSDGDAVYLGATAGTITNVKPYAPNHLVYLGVVTTASNGSAGRLYVRVQNGYELQELHNVQAQSPSLKDTLWYDSAVSPAQWKTASIPTILGYTPGTVTSVAALTLATTGTDLTSTVATGTTTPVITLNVPTASSTNRGALSSTDWTTFNNKQNTATLIFDSVQKAIIRDNYFWFLPNTISTGVAAGFGYSERIGGNTFILSGNGTLLRGLTPFSSTAIAGTIAFLRRQDTMILTGLEVVFTRKIQFNSNVSGQRFYCGISKGNQFTAPTNVEPSTLTDIVGVCQLSSSTNMHVVHNDASGTATTIDLGSSYPCTDSQYNYFITIEQTTTSYIVTVERVTVLTGASISTTNTLSTNIPNYATGTIQLLTWISNNATAAIASYLDGGGIGNVKNQ